MTRRATLRTATLALALAACGGPKAPWTEAPVGAMDLKVAVEPSQVTLLQPITVQLDLYRRKDLEVEFAPVVEPKDFLSEMRVGEEVPMGPGFWRRTTLILRPVRGPGEIVLPPFSARAKDGTIAASTPEQKISVVTALADKGAAIEAPRDPFGPAPMLWWYVAGGMVAAGLAAGVWALLQRRSARPAVAAVAVPAHVKALRALGRLRTQARTTPREIEAFYVEVSDVLRVYLEERFGLRAPERTTEEFLRDLEGGAQLAREHRAELERFLSQCDLVKFAAYVPTEDDHLATFALAEAFVERTRVDRTPEVVS